MTVSRLIAIFIIAILIMIGSLIVLKYDREQKAIKGVTNSIAKATATAIENSEINEDIKTKYSVADTIAASALNLEPSQQINHAIVAAYIVNSVDADDKFEKSTYTRRILLQVLGSQTAEKTEPSHTHLDEPQTNTHDIVSNQYNWMLTFRENNHPVLLNLHSTDPNKGPLKIDIGDNSIQYSLFSPNDKWLVLITTDQTPQLVKLEEVTDGYTAIPLYKHSLGIEDFDFSQNDKWFVTGSHDNNVRLWNLEELNRENAQEKMIELSQRDDVKYPGHKRSVTAVSFDPNSHWLGSGDLDGEIYLWNLDTGNPGLNPVHLSIANDLFVADIHFTHNDDTDLLIAIGRAKDVDYSYIWNMKIEHLMSLACEKHKPTPEQIAEIIPDSYPFEVSVCP
ncbi:MAG: hypothetical protein KDE48_08950 [Anaerolineales bacterium]|nr:hypothetical protein [Anaerolineales bacterium]